MEDIFAEIVFTAAENSPVLDKETSERYPGENRDSIQSRIRKIKAGVKATVFTTSGYGGYLENGTVKTAAQPYIWPAFEAHILDLPNAIKAELNAE